MIGPSVDCSCITCSDQAIEMVVVAFDGRRGVARCIDPDGAEREVDASLVAPVATGAGLLVHAGVAIALAPTDDGHLRTSA